MGLNTAVREVIRGVVREEVRAALREEVVSALPKEPPPIDPASRYISVARASEIAGVRPETIRSWIERGDLPGHRAGRLFRIRLDEFEAFLRLGPPSAREAVDIDERANEILSKWTAK